MTDQTINDTDNTLKAGCDKRLVRLRVGSRFWMDFQGWTWPDCPHGDSEIVFVATPERSTNGKSTLRGKGFGNPRPHYGNGSILANDSDLLDLPNDTPPPADPPEANNAAGAACMARLVRLTPTMRKALDMVSVVPRTAKEIGCRDTTLRALVDRGVIKQIVPSHEPWRPTHSRVKYFLPNANVVAPAGEKTPTKKDNE